MNYIPNYKNSFRILKGGKISLVVSAMVASTTLSFASPTGGTVTSGTASISQNGNVTNINQASNKASINWNTFNIAKNETVNFKQPSIDSITLNRVVGNESSVINGALNANGQVWILNSNGILFGKDASVNTSGILATTSELSDKDFNAENYNFKNNSSNSVVNLGTIEVSNSGSVILAAGEVKNQGTIKAVKGKVHLTAASEYTVNLNGNSLVNLIVSKGVLDAMVENSGTIIADGGEVYLTTNAVNELLKGVVNNTGIIEANSLDGLMGKVEVFAHGGEVQVGGTITAKDGFVETSGKDFKILEDATIKAGEWLIDPVDVTIDATLASTIESALGTGDVTIETETYASSSNTVDTSSNETSTDGDITDGDIYVNSNITWSSDKKLTLDADDAIYVNATIENTNTTDGGVYFQAANTTDKVIFDTDGKVVVNNVNQLQWINTALNGTYEVGSDFDASGISNFDPLGDGSTNFTGTFDGLGHTISDLTINRGSEDFVGLFGLTNSASIKDIGIVDATIKGKKYVGGLVGYNNSSTITNAYASGSVSGTGSYVGGLVSYNSYSSTITNSYASGDVSGSGDRVGGLVGYNDSSTITNSYASGDVSGTGSYVGGVVGYNDSSTITNSYASGTVSGNYVGGLVGYNYNSTITNSYASGTVSGNYDYVGGLVGYNKYSTITNAYYDKETNTATMGDSTTYGKTKAEILALVTDNTWDNTIWGIDGSTAEGYVDNKSLPYLKGVTVSLFNSGYGTDENPYTITNWIQLQNINNSNILTNNYYFGLSNSIDSDTSDYTNLANSTANSGKGWNPIGKSYDNSFKGTFDGDGNTISDLTVSRVNEDYVGLFGATNSAIIKNIGLTDIYITGKHRVGGLVGYNYRSTITNSYASGSVSGNEYVGGLVGLNSSSSTITNSYAAGTVSGTGTNIGGLSGDNIDSTISSSFYDKTKNTTSVTIDGVTGKTTEELSYGQTFKDATWDIVADSTVTSTTPVIKYDKDEAKYYWAIAPLDLSYTLSDKSKTYNGETQSLSSLYTNVFGEDYSFITGYKFQVAGSDVTGYRNAGTYSDIKVVKSGEDAFFNVKDDGSTNGKYVINKKDVSIVASSTNKIYDALTSATTSLSSTGFIGEDTVSIIGTSTFSDKNVGTNKTVTTSLLSLSGTDAGNYNITNTDKKVTSTANITAKAITVKANDLTKVYGQDDVTLTYTTDGLETGDKLTGTLKREAGEDVNSAGYAITQDTTLTNSNYTVTFTNGKYTITPKALTVTNLTVKDKVYDGTTSATLLNNGTIDKLTDDNVVFTTAVTFNNKNVETSKKINLDYTLSGDDASNYTLADAIGVETNAKITAKDITAITGITAENKTYDGTTDATLKTTNAKFTGMITTDELSVGTSTGTFVDKNVAENKIVNITNLTLSGDDKDNYNLKSSTVSTKATINKADATVTAASDSKTYTGLEQTVSGFTASGLVNGETIDVLDNVTASASGINAGTYTAIASGSDENYNLTFKDGSLTITPKAITVSANDLSKIFGEEDSVLTYTTNGLVGNDKLIGSLLRASGEEVGDYIISGDLTNSNYTITFNDGIYTIKTNDALNDIITSLTNQTALKIPQESPKTSQQTSLNTQIPTIYNSLVGIVNGGVKLPIGVEQIFFVSNNENNEEN